MCFIRGSGLLEILTKRNIISRKWLRLERVRVGQEVLNLDCENGESGNGVFAPQAST